MALSGCLSSILVTLDLVLALTHSLPVTGHDLGQIRNLASSRTPTPPPTNDFFQTTLPVVTISIYLRTIKSIYTYPDRSYVRNTNKNEFCKEINEFLIRRFC